MTLFAGIIVTSCIITLVYHIITGVPPYPSSYKEIKSIITLLKKANIPRQATIYDLGSGYGTIIKALTKSFPEANIIGIEISPIPWLISWLRFCRYRRVSCKCKNFYSTSLHNADAITAYLMISPMKKLAKKLDNELNQNTPVITVAFHFRDRKAHKTISRQGLFQADISLYIWPG